MMNMTHSISRISGMSYAKASAAMAPPRKRLPVSPINTFAGLKLNVRKPTRPPTMEEAKRPSCR